MDPLLGYVPNGPRTLGAAHARKNVTELPDGVPPLGTPFEVGGVRYTTGEMHTCLGLSVRLLMGSKGGLVMDARDSTAQELELAFPVGNLFAWRGYRWRVAGVHGVNVVIVITEKLSYA